MCLTVRLHLAVTFAPFTKTVDFQRQPSGCLDKVHAQSLIARKLDELSRRRRKSNDSRRYAQYTQSEQGRNPLDGCFFAFEW